MINEAYVRAFTESLSQCSTPIQIRELIQSYKDFMYSRKLRIEVMKRAKLLHDLSHDKFMRSSFLTIIDEYEDVAILNFVGSFSKDIQLNLSLTVTEGKVLEDVKLMIIANVLKITNARRSEAARLLGITTQQLTDIIDADMQLRKHYREIKNNLKVVDDDPY